MCPRSINRFTRCDPTKPLAPVTTTTSALPNACEDAAAAGDEDGEDGEDDVRCVVMVVSRSTADEGIVWVRQPNFNLSNTSSPRESQIGLGLSLQRLNKGFGFRRIFISPI